MQHGSGSSRSDHNKKKASRVGQAKCPKVASSVGRPSSGIGGEQIWNR